MLQEPLVPEWAVRVIDGQRRAGSTSVAVSAFRQAVPGPELGGGTQLNGPGQRAS